MTTRKATAKQGRETQAAPHQHAHAGLNDPTTHRLLRVRASCSEIEKANPIGSTVVLQYTDQNPFVVCVTQQTNKLSTQPITQNPTIAR